MDPPSRAPVLVPLVGDPSGIIKSIRVLIERGSSQGMWTWRGNGQTERGASCEKVDKWL